MAPLIWPGSMLPAAYSTPPSVIMTRPIMNRMLCIRLYTPHRALDMLPVAPEVPEEPEVDEVAEEVALVVMVEVVEVEVDVVVVSHPYRMCVGQKPA